MMILKGGITIRKIKEEKKNRKKGNKRVNNEYDIKPSHQTS